MILHFNTRKPLGGLPLLARTVGRPRLAFWLETHVDQLAGTLESPEADYERRAACKLTPAAESCAPPRRVEDFRPASELVLIPEIPGFDGVPADQIMTTGPYSDLVAFYIGPAAAKQRSAQAWLIKWAGPDDRKGAMRLLDGLDNAAEASAALGYQLSRAQIAQRLGFTQYGAPAAPAAPAAPVHRSAKEWEKYTAALSKKMKALKHLIGAKAIRQNYKGTGAQRAARQLFVVGAGKGGSVDVWLNSTGWKIGGVFNNRPYFGPEGKRKPTTKPYQQKGPNRPTVDATWAELRAAMLNWAGK